MREMVAARDWLTVFWLRAYASGLNPAEPAWALSKRPLVKPDQAHTIGELTVPVNSPAQTDVPILPSALLTLTEVAPL